MRCAKPRIDFRAAAATFPDILIPKCRHIVKTPISTYSQGILILGAKKEYEKIEKEVNFNFLAIKKPIQTHTNIVKVLTKENLNDDFQDVDGLITDLKGVALVTSLADCQGILLYDPIKKIIGNIHSGWKGTLNKIIVNAIKLMEENFECDPKNIEAYICPSILKCCFEVDKEVVDMFYENYKYKMNLMTEIAAKEEFSGLDAVSELLKDKDIETNEQGRRLLEQYGYWGNKGNAFYSQFRHQVMVTGAVSTVICVLLLTFLLYWKKKEDACHQKILDQLEEILIRFRENKFDDLLKTENHAELEKLNDQLEAIGHHIQLIKEEARAEKENTKEMVSDISHQLKTPVAALDTCFSVLMQNDLSATEQEEFRIRCRSALDGLETLLQSLLEISKMETGLIQINKKKLPLMDTVISAVNRTYPKADEKEIEFVFDYEKELETCTIMQDKRWLGEAVINVLDNAVKYSPCGSKIFIRLQKRNDLVRMEIEDQGIGIPQNEYHKIFQRFYRGSSKEVMEKSGTGIGLFLSREIIEKHAGTITVTSGKKKKGSTFVIQLPYVG